MRCSAGRGFRWVACALSVLAAAALARGASAGYADGSQVEGFTGARTKVVWARKVAAGSDCYTDTESWELWGYDSATATAHRILTGHRTITNPMVTPDGQKVVFGGGAGAEPGWPQRLNYRICVVGFDDVDGTPQELDYAQYCEGLPAIFLCLVAGSDGYTWIYTTAIVGWVYGDCKVFRHRFDDPANHTELAWYAPKSGPEGSAVAVGLDFRASADGTCLGTTFFDPDRPDIEGRRGGRGNTVNDTYEYYHDMGSCNAGLAPDNSCHFMQFSDSHKSMTFVPGGSSTRRSIDLIGPISGGEADITTGDETWAIRWTSDARYFTLTAPLHVFPNMPDADVFLCRFSSDFTSVEGYVRITDTSTCDQLPYAWIESGVQANVTIDSFTADPQSVAPGGSSTLSWSTSNATSARIDNGVGDVSLSGTRVVNPLGTTTYTLTAEGPGGPVTATVTVSVTQEVTINQFVASPASIAPGATSNLLWSTTNADSVRIDPGAHVSTAASGSWPVSPDADTTYTLTAFGQSGQPTASATVYVVQGSPTITLYYPVGGELIAAGSDVWVVWDASPEIGNVVLLFKDAEGNWQYMVNAETGTDAVANSCTRESPYWGAFPWRVPDGPIEDCAVTIAQYGGVGASVVSGEFSVVDVGEGAVQIGCLPVRGRTQTGTPAAGRAEGWIAPLLIVAFVTVLARADGTAVGPPAPGPARAIT
jgi:hypothetical protein